MPNPQTANDLFESLKQSKPRVVLDGVVHYVVEGDLVLDEDQLLVYAIRRVDVEAHPEVERQGLVAVADSSGRIVRWRPGKVLSYRVDKPSFPAPAQYQTVVNAMLAATADWEAICGVDFKHQAQWDDAPPSGPIKPLFTVAHFDAGGEFIAAAFFPNDPPGRRVVLIDPSYFSPSLSFDKVGVLRHELGHVLGFRHEHIRSGAPPNCPDESTANTVDLTAYDPRSVMHYFCGGVGSRELAITDVDRAGARMVYGPPASEVAYMD